jgi:hypothetical protein
VEDTILHVFRRAAIPGPKSSIEPELLREKHSIFLRRGLKHLSDAYEVRLFIDPKGDSLRSFICNLFAGFAVIGCEPSMDLLLDSTLVGSARN